jgi:hypothetical protein
VRGGGIDHGDHDNMESIEEFLQKQAASGALPVSDEVMSEAQFALDSPRAVVVRSGGGSSKPRPDRPPEQDIVRHRKIARDPTIQELVNTLVDYIWGNGYNVSPANIPYTEQGQELGDIADFKFLFENSAFETVGPEWVRTALIDGTAFLEIVVTEDEKFKPKIIPTEQMKFQRDKFGHVTGYIQKPLGQAKEIQYKPYDLAVLRFFPRVDSPFGDSVISFIEEQADMIRDMEYDLARFIATKAYPPVHWKCGSPETGVWSKTETQDWLDTLRDIEPDSMIATGYDVEHDIVGTTSTSAQAGMINLDPVFLHLLNRIHAGMGVPSFLLGNGDAPGKNESIAIMPKFDRRIQRFRRVLRHAIRYQIFVSILGEDNPEEYQELPPEYEFGQHSSEEERLDAQTTIALVNAGLLTREAAAERLGIDPEVELPTDAELDEHIATVNALAGKGDAQQNPDGGRPTQNGTGNEDAGRSVKTRQNPERQNPDSRPKSDISNE